MRSRQVVSSSTNCTSFDAALAKKSRPSTQLRCKFMTALALVSPIALGFHALPRPAVFQQAPASIMMADDGYDAGVKEESEEAEALPYFCNDEGCWVGTPPPVVLPDGREFTMGTGVASHETVQPKRKPSQVGIFAPVVGASKAVLGEKQLNQVRGDVIAAHSKVISAFVDTSESPFGQIVLKQMFEAADKDGNGTLDREEVRDALQALGFTFIEDKQLNKIFERGDTNGDEVIDFEEFVKETPKTLRSSLIKLAKTNGHDLGFLA